MLLEIRGLRVHYGRAEALKDVSLAVDEGAIVALVERTARVRRRL